MDEMEQRKCSQEYTLQEGSREVGALGSLISRRSSALRSENWNVDEVEGVQLPTYST